jgi:8-oxo-dGTP pyrophosphatase MutT (NUDIX family)
MAPMASPPGEIVEPQPAASVVLLRDVEGGLEILYLRRSPHLRFMGGYWVFPGGRIDPGDHQAGNRDASGTARRAAVREAQEEAGVTLDPASLHPISQWTTPTASPIRFATSFFVAESDDSPIQVDGVEIHAHQWHRPEEALRAHRAGTVQFANPTFVFTTRLAEHTTVRDALAAVDTWPMEQMLGRIVPVEGGRVALYTEDCGYASRTVDCPGPRHRVWMLDAGWRYERRF